jgi:hypothetical protein
MKPIEPSLKFQQENQRLNPVNNPVAGKQALNQKRGRSASPAGKAI